MPFQREEEQSEYTLRLLEQLLEIGVLPSKCDTFVVKDLSLLADLLLNGRLALLYCQVLFEKKNTYYKKKPSANKTTLPRPKSF